MTPLEVLRRTRNLLESGWTKRAFARNSLDESVYLHDLAACKWCVGGAVHRAAGLATPIQDKGLIGAFDRLCALTKPLTITEFNDHPERTHAEVLALLDRAIAEQAKEGEGG